MVFQAPPKVETLAWMFDLKKVNMQARRATSPHIFPFCLQAIKSFDFMWLMLLIVISLIWLKICLAPRKRGNKIKYNKINPSPIYSRIFW